MRAMSTFTGPVNRIVRASAQAPVTRERAAAEVTRLREEVARLRESYDTQLDNKFWWQGLDPSRDFDRGGYGFGGGLAVDRAQDRTHAALPYLTETQWRMSLALVRQLAQRNHLLIGFRDHVAAFIGPVSVSFVDRGAAPGATSSGPVDADGNGEVDASSPVKLATEAWEEWCEVNDWGLGKWNRERECRRRLILEGERTLEFFKGDYGRVPAVRIVEPELIRSPLTVPDGYRWATDEDWKHGILTRPNDADSEEAMYVSDPDGTDGRVVRCDRFVRDKGNVDRCVKRGMSDFFCVTSLVEKVQGLLEAMAHVARLQAKIAWWEQFTNATQAQLQALNDAQRTRIQQGVPVGPYAGSATQAGTNVKDYDEGSVIQTDMRTVLPGPTATPEGFIAIEQAVMRSVSFRFGLPSSFTGDADSFASALVTGSPFATIIQERQEQNEGFTRDVVRTALALCEESGRLPRGTSRLVKPVLTSRPVVIADEEKKARKFLSLYEKNCASPQEYIRSEGGEPAQVAADIAAWQEKFPPPGPSGPNPPPAPTDPTPAPPGSAGGDQSSPNNPFGESLSERDYQLLTEADRTGLVQKEITDRNGRKSKRWVKAAAAPAAKREPAAGVKPDAAAVHAEVKGAFAEPASLTPEKIADLATKLKSLSVDQIKAIQAERGVKGGTAKGDRVQKLIDAAKAKAAVPKEPAAKEPAAPAVDVAAVYDRSGSTAKHSEVNAAIRAAAAMTPEQAVAVLAKMGHLPGDGDPRRQLAMLLVDRKGAQLRRLSSGATSREAAAKASADYHKKYDDEPLLDVRTAFAGVPPAKAAPAAKPVAKSAPDTPHAKARAALDAAGIDHGGFSDDQLVKMHAALSGAFGAPPAAAKPAAKAKPAAAKAGGAKVDDSERAVRSEIARDRDASHGTASDAERAAQLKPLLDRIRATHTPAEIHELAVRVAGKRDKTPDLSLARIAAAMTQVQRTIANQNV